MHLIPSNQTTVLQSDETLDGAFEWLGGQDGLVVDDGRPVGTLGPRDVEEWYRRVIEGRSTPDGLRGAPSSPGSLSVLSCGPVVSAQ